MRWFWKAELALVAVPEREDRDMLFRNDITEHRRISQSRCSQSRCSTGRVIRTVGLAIVLMTLPVSAFSESRNLDLSGFDGVSATSGIRMVVDEGDEFSVTAESEAPRHLDHLLLDVRRSTLRARMERTLFDLRLSRGREVTVRVSLPQLIHADASAGARVEIDKMDGQALELTASSGARLEVDRLTGRSIVANASSGADIAAEAGACDRLEAVASSGARLELFGVECTRVQANASSGSNASVFADDRIDASSSSGSTISVHGAHERIEINTSSGGRILFP